ncbi:hypothetical protein Lal_00012485 [Lupinus albus]|nr:hypothetical protein Lal_00012485 [Lupinus albus]
MTRSGIVYSPIEIAKEVVNTSKGNEKIEEPTRLLPQEVEREATDEETCEFLQFIKQRSTRFSPEREDPRLSDRCLAWAIVPSPGQEGQN